MWAAEDGAGQGEEAFRRIVFGQHQSIRCQTLRREPGPRNLRGQWEQLLLDAARVEDEEARLEAAPVREFDEVWEEGVAALRAKDYPAALRAFLEAKALRPVDAWVTVNLERLRRMGYGTGGAD